MANTRGRQPIGINQPPGGGTNYPFVKPSSDIKYLLGDLFVSFDDLDDTYAFPLKVSWMYGFGTNVVAPPPGYPSPTHAQDIIVTDANDVVVFDSTTASKFTSDAWDSRLLILEWTNTDSVLRCVQHTEWTQADIDDGLTQTYDDYIEPASGVLQVDTWYKMPKRITSLQVGVTTVNQTNVVTFSEGYNMSIGQSDLAIAAQPLPRFGDAKPLVEGTRASSSVLFASESGAGLGIFPGCSDQVLEIKTLNRVASNAYQNFTYDTEGCIRSQRPVGLTSSFPREFDYASFVLPAAEAAAAIETLNDCTNCCDCTYFAQTYQGLKRQWFLYRDVAEQAETARNLYQENIDRWEIQKTIRERDTLRLRVSMNGSCKVDWGFAHCNASRCCITNVKADITFLYYLNGVLTEPENAGYDCEVSEIDGSEDCNGAAPIVLDVNATGQHAEAFWDFADPQFVTTVRGRFCFPDCSTVEEGALKVRMHVVISWENSGNDPATGDPCTYPLLDAADYADYPDLVSTWATLGVTTPSFGRVQAITPLTIVQSTNPLCSRCDCEVQEAEE